MVRMRARWLFWIAGVAIAAAVVWSFVPKPIGVDVAPVTRGPLVVSIDEDGRTRVRDRYTVSAPVSGYLSRIALRPGAPIKQGEAVARIFPAVSAPLDERTRSQLQSRVSAAADSVRQARMRVNSARAAHEQARRELDRQLRLERDRVVSAQEVDVVRTRERVAEADLRGAAAGLGVAEHEVQAARAALLAVDAEQITGRVTDVRAPQGGAVLRVFEESARAIQAGAPLVEIGAPAALEIVADLLTTDAVQVQPGARVLIDRWGGEGELHGCVRLVEPSSFTKISALGVEEQRVNVVIDLTDSPQTWQRLGDGFGVEVRIVTWADESALKVPVSALFRRGDDWCVYKIVASRAIEQCIRSVHRNDRDAAVDAGLSDGDRVIVHPGERIRTGTRVVVR